MLTLWNVSVMTRGVETKLKEYQFYSLDIYGAIKQAEEFGEVVKVVMAILDDKK